MIWVYSYSTILMIVEDHVTTGYRLSFLRPSYMLPPVTAGYGTKSAICPKNWMVV